MSNRVTDTTEGRQTSRISLSLPIIVHGKDSEQQAFRENTHTLLVNKHGAKLVVSRALIVGQEVLIENPALATAAKANVVWVGSKRNASGLLEVGVQLAESVNIWGIEFPPDDWSANGKARLEPPKESTTYPPAVPSLPATQNSILSSEQIAAQILKDMHATAEAHVHHFTERLDQLVQRIGLETEIDLRTRATAAKEAELTGLDHQIAASTERLAELRSEAEELEARLEAVQQALSVTLDEVPPPLTPEQIHEKVQEDALGVLHLITEGGIAAARERLQAQLKTDIAQMLGTWRESVLAERETILEEAREQAGATVDAALATLNQERDAAFGEIERYIQEEISAGKERAASQIKSKLDVAGESHAAGLVERLVENVRETGERQADLLRTQLDALLVGRLEEAQKHARSVGESLKNGAEEYLRAAGEKNVEELNTRLQEVTDQICISSTARMQKEAEDSAAAAAGRNLQQWETRLQEITDQAMSAASDQVHARVVDAATTIAEKHLQQSESRLQEFAHTTVAASSERLRSQIEGSTKEFLEKRLLDFQAHLNQAGETAVATTTTQLGESARLLAENTSQQTEARLQEIADKAVASTANHAGARTQEMVEAAEKTVQSCQARLQTISEEAIASSSQQVGTEIEKAALAAGEDSVQRLQVQMQDIVDNAVDASCERVRVEVETSAGAAAKQVLNDCSSQLHALVENTVATAAGQMRTHVEEAVRASAEAALASWNLRLQEIADGIVDASSARMRSQIEETARHAADVALQEWQARLQQVVDNTAGASSEQIRTQMEESGRRVAANALEALQENVQAACSHAAAETSERVQSQINDALGLLMPKLQEMQERMVNEALETFRGRMSQMLGFTPPGGSK